MFTIICKIVFFFFFCHSPVIFSFSNVSGAQVVLLTNAAYHQGHYSVIDRYDMSLNTSSQSCLLSSLTCAVW